jgi:hypothetical protein
MRIAVWLAFLGCIAVLLAANAAAAPRLAWPPVALLLAVELLAHRSRSPRSETEPVAPPIEPAAPVANPVTETDLETGRVIAHLQHRTAVVFGSPHFLAGYVPRHCRAAPACTATPATSPHRSGDTSRSPAPW